VKLAGVAAAIIGAVALQMAFARFTVGGRWSIDLVLVAVAFIALKWGPGAGIIGVGGLAKTIVGFLMGVIGSQFIVARPAPRMRIEAGATLANRLLVQAILSAIALHWAGVRWPVMLTETALNALSAFVLFQSIDTLPALLRRGPSRRSNFGKRKW
jgi:thiamine transporter ThiT